MANVYMYFVSLKSETFFSLACMCMCVPIVDMYIYKYVHMLMEVRGQLQGSFLSSFPSIFFGGTGCLTDLGFTDGPWQVNGPANPRDLRVSTSPALACKPGPYKPVSVPMGSGE